MADLFELNVLSSSLHLVGPGAISASGASAAENWAEVGRLCEQYSRARVLIEIGTLSPPQDTMSAFESGKALAEHCIGMMIAIAPRHYEVTELTSFFKTVAQNRGVNIEFFRDIDEARQWLDVEAREDAAGNG